jgi:hypothetical protein
MFGFQPLLPVAFIQSLGSLSEGHECTP